MSTMPSNSPEPSAPQLDVQAELAALAHGLASHVRRRRHLGKRTLLARTATPHATAARAPSAARVSSVPKAGSKTLAEVRAQAVACEDLASLRAAVAECTACGLCKTRTQTVFMDGSGTRKILFVGEAPGADEDRTGVPFVGRAGQLLTDIITKGMGLERSEVHIVNVIKCRPPENREPSTEEKEMCTPWLDRQIELVQPSVIVALGKHAATYLLGLRKETTMNAMRGRVHEHRGRRIVVTFHPAYLLRSPGEKKECWKDIKLVMELVGLAGE